LPRSFSKDFDRRKRNTDAIEIAPGVLVAARVLEHEPEKQRPFADVKGDIEATLKRDEAAKLAQKEGAAKLEQLAKGGDAGLTFSQPKVVTMRDPGTSRRTCSARSLPSMRRSCRPISEPTAASRAT
jgi:peptidyl-prolyl cis-trans isomerase D